MHVPLTQVAPWPQSEDEQQLVDETHFLPHFFVPPLHVFLFRLRFFLAPATLDSRRLPSPSPAPTSPRKMSRREGMRLNMCVMTPKRVWSTVLPLVVGTRHLGRSDLLRTTALIVPAGAGMGILCTMEVTSIQGTSPD